MESGQIRYYTEGYPIITKYLNLYPCNYILNARGLFSMAAKEYEQALKDFRKILERDPADQFAYNNIGCALKYQGQYELALPYFEKALYYMYREGKEEPNATTLGNKAQTYELMGEYALAAQTYEKLIDTFSEQQESLASMKNITVFHDNLSSQSKRAYIGKNHFFYSFFTLLHSTLNCRAKCNCFIWIDARVREFMKYPDKEVSEYLQFGRSTDQYDLINVF